jgi:hypothetical protein
MRLRVVKTSLRHFVPATSPLFPKRWAWAGVVLFLIIAAPLQASDLPPPFTVNLPFAANQATPIWLGHPETPQTTFATLNLPITPPDANAALLITVFFQEKEGGFLRIAWQGPQVAQTVSDNFYEGIGMSNQRSLLLSPETLTGGGTLMFQCGDATLGIQRIKLEWLENRNGLVSPQVQDLLVTPSTGTTQPAQNLNGQAKPADAAAWQAQIVTVPITDLPQRIEQGVEFSVQLDNVPASGRLALKETGLPLGKNLIIWINQQRAGTITPAVPDLAEDGYLSDATASPAYVGWRDGSFYVPVAVLKTGVNTVQFSVEDDLPSANAAAVDPSTSPTCPLAVKDLVFQLNYPVSPADANASPSPTAATPSGPVTPAPLPASPTPTPVPTP